MPAPAMSSSKTHSYTWTFPGCPVKVGLDASVAEGIQRGFSSMADGTSQAKQGLLLGEIVNGDTRITNFLPVADLAGEMNEAVRTAELSAVGFYRMRPGDTLQLSGDEIAAARSFCQRPGAVVLLVQPRKTGSAEATFFFFDRDLLCGGYLHFPFAAALPGRPEFRSEIARLSHATPSAPSRVAPSPSNVTASLPSKSRETIPTAIPPPPAELAPDSVFDSALPGRPELHVTPSAPPRVAPSPPSNVTASLPSKIQETIPPAIPPPGPAELAPDFPFDATPRGKRKLHGTPSAPPRVAPFPLSNVTPSLPSQTQETLPPAIPPPAPPELAPDFPFDAALPGKRELHGPPSPPSAPPRVAASPHPQVTPSLPSKAEETLLSTIPPAGLAELPQPIAKSQRQRTSWRKGLAMILLAVAAMAGGAALTWMFRTPPPTSEITVKPMEAASTSGAGTDTRIELHAQRQGRDLKITWDHPLIRPESTGILAITDGTTHRLLPLERDQLRFGSVLYAPKSEEVKAELTISHGNQVDARGSVLVLMSGPAPRVIQQVLAPAPRQDEAEGNEEPLVKRGPTRPFVAGQAKKNEDVSRGNIELPLPPVAGQPALQLQPQVPAVDLRPEPPPPATNPSPSIVTYTGAVATFKVTPAQPAELRAVLSKEATVRVKVQIDEKGRVTKADPVLEKGVHQLLVGAAVRAALAWRFAPARMGDRGVPSEMTLEFRFVRK